MKYNAKLKNIPYENLQNITLDFISFKCGKVVSEMRKFIKNICPDFSPLLKPKITHELNINVSHSLNCPCNSATHEGQTCKLLEYRVYQHRLDSESQIKEHIDTCQTYRDLLSIK